MTELTTIFWRTVFFYFFLLFAVRIMGKHSLGQLSPFDFVVTIMLAETAVLAIEQPSLHILGGIIPIVVLVALEMLLAFASLKNRRLRNWMNGQPAVVIRDGRIVESELRRLRYNLDDLLEQLRLKNAPDVADVDFAIWEPSGQLSVVPKASQRSLQPSDLGLEPVRRGLPSTLIADGRANENALQELGLTADMLEDLLTRHGLGPIDNVFLASLDRQGDLWVQVRGKPGDLPKPRTIRLEKMN